MPQDKAKRIAMLVVAVIIAISVSSLALAALSCYPTNTTCSGTIVLYVKGQNSDGSFGWANAHAELPGAGSYTWGICCSDTSGQTIGTNCSTTGSEIFLKLYSPDNSHVEVYNGTTYTNNACISATNRVMNCTYQTGSCPTGDDCIASIASSEGWANNITNAHVDANCSAVYPTDICCGYSNSPPIMNTSRIAPQPAYTNASLEGFCNATDADSDNVTYYYKWYINSALNSSGVTSQNYTQGFEINVANISNSSLTVGQNWTLSCLASDSLLNSSWLNSTQATIVPLVPQVPQLISPTNNNNTLIARQPTFIWNSTSATTWYEINITSNNCAGTFSNNTNIGANTSNFTPSSGLCLQTEGGANTYYNWSVHACNSQACSNYSTTWNFSIMPYLAITLASSNVQFGNMSPNEEANTTNLSISPFLLRNDGNVYANMTNVTINQTLWYGTAAGLGTSYFQLEAGVTNETGSFNTTYSTMNWVNASSTTQGLVKMLDYNDASDTSYVHMHIKVPADEPPGNKSTYIIFNWQQG